MLRRVCVLLAAFGGIAFIAGCSDEGAQQGVTSGANEPPAEGITVIGTGQISGEPDTFRATVGVEVERQSVNEAINAANTAAEQVISAVQEQGVEGQNIQTTEFSVYPRFSEPPMRPEPTEPQDEPEIRGYIVTNFVETKIQDLERVGEVLQAAVEAGGDAARVQGVSFTLEDNEELLEAAREAAFADARRRANHYAELSERDLGALVSVSEAVEGDTSPVPNGDLPAAAGAESQAVPTTPGEEEVTVRITAVWAMN